MLLCARRALGYAFAELEGKTGLTVCMVVISAASAALFFAGSDAALAAVPLLGAALVIAGLAAEGTTEIEEIDHIDRGYEDVVEKFSALGADIKRVPIFDNTVALKQA